MDITTEQLLAHAGFVRRLARSLLQDVHAADDLAQDTLTAALERKKRIRAPRAWLATVARRLAARRYRSEARRMRRELEAARPDGAPPPDEITAQAELQRRLAREVRALEEPHRTVIVLRFFHDLSAREIAERLGEPHETIRSRLRRALQRLRARLDEAHGGDRRAWSLAMLAIAQPEGRAASALVAGGAAVMTVKAKLAVAVLVVLGSATAFAVWVRARTPSLAPRASIDHVERSTAAASALASTTEPGAADRATATATSEVRVLGKVVRADGMVATELVPYAVGAGDERRLLDATARVDGDDFELRFPFEAEEATWPIDVGVHGRGFLRQVHPLEVSAGGTYEVEFALAEGLSLRGQIDGPDGAPLRDLEILAVPRRRPEGFLVSYRDLDTHRLLLEPSGDLTHFARGRTDASGRFELLGLEVGTYVILSTDEAWFLDHGGVVEAGGPYAAVEAIPARSVWGRVRDARTGEPIQNAHATWHPAVGGSPWIGTRVVEDRVLAIWRQPRGSKGFGAGLEVAVRAEGYHEAVQVVTFEDGQRRTSFDVALQPVDPGNVGTVRISVLDAWGRPCEEEVTFKVTDADGAERVIEVLSGRAGTYRLSTTPGCWRLFARLDDSLPLETWRGEINVVRGRETFVRCKFPPFGVLRIRCDATEDWDARVRMADGSTAFSGSVDAGEEARLLVDPGEWGVVLSGSRYDAPVKPVTIGAGEETVVQIPE